MSGGLGRVPDGRIVQADYEDRSMAEARSTLCGRLAFSGCLLLLQASLPQAVQQFRRSRLQRGILVLLFLIILGDPIEVESRAEWRFLKCFERFARICIFIR